MNQINLKLVKSTVPWISVLASFSYTLSLYLRAAVSVTVGGPLLMRKSPTCAIITRGLYQHQISADLEKNGGQKCSTGQRFICIEVTSYKIHTLILISCYHKAKCKPPITDIFKCPTICMIQRPLRQSSSALKITHSASASNAI